jgi:hypothetical protein
MFVLIALAGGPVHGYTAMQDTRDRAAGRVRVSTGCFTAGCRC